MFQVANHRLSVGVTPKSLRLPKHGEMLLSVRGSPLGVYREENLETINGRFTRSKYKSLSTSLLLSYPTHNFNIYYLQNLEIVLKVLLGSAFLIGDPRERHLSQI